MRRPRPPLLIRLALALTLIATAVLARNDAGRAQEAEPAPALLDGSWLSAEEAAAVNGQRPVAVMVDNYIDGRPQIGLDRADLIYELLVEGGITRFMAVYLRQDADWVEPVRSARTPFLYLAGELGAIVGHVGAAATEGPANTLEQFYEWGIPHLDEQTVPGPFWRDRNRRAPYNAATSTSALREAAREFGVDGPATLESWQYKDDFEVYSATRDAAASLSYAFFWGGPPQYAFSVEWHYDPAANAYRRSMAGRPHNDGRTGARLIARNVIVQFDSAAIINHEGHILYGSIGEGPAYIFLDGQVLDADWRKPSLNERTRYYDLTGEEIRLNRGVTWVAILPYGSPMGWR